MKESIPQMMKSNQNLGQEHFMGAYLGLTIATQRVKVIRYLEKQISEKNDLQAKMQKKG